MTEILRQPGRVANGLSTITARLTKKNDEYIKSITKGQGVIDEQTGELRSTFDILQDLSKAWGDLTSVEKQELTETVAGKTQRSLFTAIMTNFETAVGATEAALNSEGSAMEENNKRMDSLEGKTKKLQSAWQQLARTTVNSDFIKGSLDFLTNLIKIGDALGGLVPIVSSLLGMVLMFKAQQIGEKVGEFSNAITSLINGFKILKQRIFGATNANVIYLGSAESAQVATTGLAASMSMLSLAVGAVTAAISLTVMFFNALKQAQKEATNASVENIEKSEDIIQAKEDEVKKLEEQIDALDKEKDAYIESKDAKDKNSDNSDFIKSKDKEIAKRQENIDKINEEILAEKRQSVSQADSISGEGAGGLGYTKALAGLGWSHEYYSAISDINEKLKEVNGNAGAYNRVLKEQEKKYVELQVQQKKNNQDTSTTNDILTQIRRKIKDNNDSYEVGKKKADAYYKALKGIGKNAIDIGIGEEQINYLKEFYNLSDVQIEQLKNGKDVLAENTEANKDNADSKYVNANATQELADKQKEMQDNLIYTNENIKSLNDEIDNMQSAYGTLTSAIDEYNSSGGITMDTLQSLLALDGDYLNSLEMVNGKLQINKKAQEEHAKKIQQDTLALIENAAMQDLQAQATNAAGNVASSAAEQIYRTGENAKTAGDYASKGAGGFVELAGAMAQAGMVKLDNVDVNAWANKWASVTSKIKDLTSGISLSSSNFTGGSKTSGSKSKSSKEVYKPEIDALYKYENALDNAKDAVDRLNDALKNTDNFNEREKYLNQLIKATKDQIKATNNLKNAQVGQINNYIKQLKKQGFQISYNSKTNQLNINNMERLGRFTGDTAKNIEKMIKKIQDLNKDNRSLDGSIRDLNADISDFNDQIKALPEEKLKKFNELMEEFQQSRLDQIQNEITDLQHEMENDPRLKMLEEQIAALEKQNDELDSQKELEEKLLAVEEAKIKLQNAQRQKTLQVYREGQGFVYEADPDTIKEAADELQQAQDDLNDKIKQDEIDRLNAEKEALENSYQSRIDALQNFLDEQNYLIDKANKEGIQTFEELQKKMAEFGLDNAENLKTATDWLNNYNKSLSDLNKTVGSILSSSTTATDGLIYSSQTQDKINNALSSIMPKIDSKTGLTLSNIRAETTDKNSNTGSIYINSIELPNVKDIDDFIAALKDLPRMASSQSTLRI